MQRNPFQPVPANNIDDVPKGFINHQALKRNSCGDICIETGGGSHDQPVGRIYKLIKLLSKLSAPVLCASFCKLIRPNTNLVTPGTWILQSVYLTRMVESIKSINWN